MLIMETPNQEPPYKNPRQTMNYGVHLIREQQLYVVNPPFCVQN